MTTPAPATDKLALSGASAAQPAPSAASRVQLRFQASQPASMYWVLNALANDPHVDAAGYQKFWQGATQKDPQDDALLAQFARIRDKYQKVSPGAPVPRNAFIPVAPPSAADQANDFAAAFVGAKSPEEAFARLARVASPADVQALKRIFAHFQPRFDQQWARMDYLGQFTQAFESYADRIQLSATLERAAVFYAVPPKTPLATRTSFVFASPEQQGTTGRMLGSTLVAETLPGEQPADRVAVVAHETSHYLHAQGRATHEGDFQAAFYATRDPLAGQAIDLLDEALATAIGQGVVAEQADPAQFKRALTVPNSWYDDARIDAYAKAAFPIVKNALRDGKTLVQVAPALMQAYHTAFPNEVPTPAGLLANKPSLLLGASPGDPSFKDYFNTISPGQLIVPRSLAAGAAFPKLYAALPVVVTLTSADLPDLGPLAKDLGLAGADLKTLATAGSGVFVHQRPSGGYSFLVVGKQQADLAPAMAKFAQLTQLQEGWSPL